MTPPYLLICFYVTCVLAALYDLALHLTQTRVYPALVALNSLQLGVTALLTWIAGTYPLQAVWPGPNVARPSDVSLHFVCIDSARVLHGLCMCPTAVL